MVLLKKILDFYIRSSVHIAVAVTAMTYVTAYQYGFLPNKNYLLSVFFGTIVGYNYLRYIQFPGKIIKSLLQYPRISIVTILAIIGGIYGFFLLNFTIQKILIIAGILVFLYPFLRSFGILKMFWVALVITILVSFIPLVEQKTPFDTVLMDFISKFFFYSALMIPFEIKDMTDDQYMNTLPQKAGELKSKYFGYFFLIVFLFLEWMQWNIYHVNLDNFNKSVLIGIITAMAIYKANSEENGYFVSFWVESIPVLWLLFYVF